ncbi:leucine--tRNA ligase [Desulfurella sp.]|uniref:leucine--tRNA ligase n=1 Tax=Desulfurella sp. TaxID=1962857 RepID=UPI0025BDB4E7|nr:leucine--tRNA ligase [Desulfurella sp.]
MEKYNPSVIEKKWQEIWDKLNLNKAVDFDEKPKYYCLEMFPYPSGKIHMGHVRNYTIGDVIARFKRYTGYNVLHPIGFDAFGLPAENAAINAKIHPAKWTYANMDYMLSQLQKLGFSYDKDRIIATCDPKYYKWEQKIFIEMFKRGMAYRKESEVNFCPHCQTVLANEQVEDGRCWRCDSEVVKKTIFSWYFKITDYADELLEDIKLLEDGWPNRVLSQQINWIGKSEGAFIKFKFEKSDEYLEVFTTRPDTLFGVTFVSISPKHPKVKEFVKDRNVLDYVEKMIVDLDIKKDYGKEKDGIYSGINLINPVNNEIVPLYIANFVLMEYGTGVVMGVPAHDQRDFEFATKFNIPKKIVIYREDLSNDVETWKSSFVDSGFLVNSGEFNGLQNELAKEKIVEYLTSKNLARKAFQYKLRDWNVSRQRYWGAPIPIIYCPNCGVVPESIENLPVELPENVEITGFGGSPLSKVESFVNTTCPICGAKAKRETDTFDTFVESSWYFLRYCSPDYDKDIFDKQKVKYWMDVDQYIGGIEHAVMHLLYARYFTKVLRDLGYLDSSEPFKRLLTQGMVIKDGAKMSKSKGNVVDPDDIVNTYGADTARLFILFAAPVDKDLEWSDEGIEGSFRFLNRLYRLIANYAYKVKDAPLQASITPRIKELLYEINSCVQKVTNDIENYHFNTAIAKLMEFVNFLYSFNPEEDELGYFKEALEKLTIMASPFVPHLACELWEMLGHDEIVFSQSWPKVELEYATKDTVKIAITINGKLRDTIEATKDADQKEVEKLALNSEKVKKHLEGKEIKKYVYVKNKILNIIV